MYGSGDVSLNMEATDEQLINTGRYMYVGELLSSVNHHTCYVSFWLLCVP